MRAMDFSRSYMKRTASPVNNARILVQATVTVIDDDAGRSDTYYLMAPCRGEHTHASGTSSRTLATSSVACGARPAA